MTSLDEDFEELIIRLNKAEARVTELESTKYINSVKADAIDEFWTSMLLECLGSDNGVDAVLDCYTNDNLLTPVKEYYVDNLRTGNELPS